MGNKDFTISEDHRKEYVAGFLLDLMIKKNHRYFVTLEGADRDLEPLLVYMMTKDYISLDKENYYVPTNKGKEKLNNLKKKYEEYLMHFDIFCAVDLENGEFAFENFFKMEDEEWERYLNQENFVDLRIAVAWFKKVNPADFVFLSFLKEERFSLENNGWQFDLLSGLMWEEIEEIINSAIQIEELGYVTEDSEEVTGMEVMEDVIREGAKLNEKLYKEEENLRCENGKYPNDYYDSDSDADYSVNTFNRYYEPSYASPFWFIF